MKKESETAKYQLMGGENEIFIFAATGEGFVSCYYFRYLVCILLNNSDYFFFNGNTGRRNNGSGRGKNGRRPVCIS